MRHSLKITKFGGPEVFQWVQESPLPLTPHGVRIQVGAAGVNFADIMMRIGSYPEAPKPPFAPGYEVAGKVTEVGKEVTKFQVGDRVLAGTRFGGYTTEIVLPEYLVRKIPGKLSETEAAAIPVNFLTAWVALQEMARVRKGDRVLVQSAAGGVGIAATQIAAQAGAKVVGLVGSNSKFDLVRSFGASEVMTYSEWESGRDQDLGGYSIILDSMGGESLKRSYRRLSPGGRVITFGVSNLVSGEKRSFTKLFSVALQTFLFTPFKLMMDNKGIYGLNMLQLFEEPRPGVPHLMFDAFDSLLKRFDDGSLRVLVGKTFPMKDGGAAHMHLQSRQNVGKVILTP